MLLKEVAFYKSFRDALGQQHQEIQNRKRSDMESKYNTGEPVEIELPVFLRKSMTSGEPMYEKRKFIIDNLLDIRRKLSDVVLQDLHKVSHDPKGRRESGSYTIRRSQVHPEASIPAYLHGLPSGTRRKPGYPPEDFRREAFEG